MYRAMIIDDEPVIVEGLRKLLPWEKYGCSVIAEAYNGQEGLEKIRALKPDIVFTDISMPGLSGLQMIAGLKVELPDTQICILTGYRDFEFAQQAIRLGVTRFLLKPSNMDELEEALQAMTDHLKKIRPEGEKPAEDDQTLPEDAEPAAGFIVRNALKYMEEHYSEKLTLSSVAENIYVSQWHLSKLLNREEGKNFSEILNNIRIRHAKELLKDPAYRIADISDLLGFADVAHFSRVFKKTVGISANEYRNRVSE